MIGARTPQPDFTVVPEPPPPSPLPPTPERNNSVSWKNLTIGIVTALVVAASAAAFVLGKPSPPDRTPEIVVGGFAEDFVFTYLSTSGEGSEDSLVPYLGYAPSLTGMQAGAFYVTKTTIRDLTEGHDGWDVIVGVNLLALANDGYIPTSPRHFLVQLVDSPGAGLRAEALPTPVPIPVMASGQAQQKSDQLPEGSSAEDLAGYLDWHLTQQTPIAGAVPIGGFVTTILVSLEVDGNTAIAGVLATTDTGHALRLDIPLIMEDGGWRAADIGSESG